MECIEYENLYDMQFLFRFKIFKWPSNAAWNSGFAFLNCILDLSRVRQTTWLSRLWHLVTIWKTPEDSKIDTKLNFFIPRNTDKCEFLNSGSRGPNKHQNKHFTKSEWVKFCVGGLGLDLPSFDPFFVDFDS